MLTLSRNAGQSIAIGKDILIVIHQIKGSQVKIGIVAPRSIRVRRSELDCKCGDLDCDECQFQQKEVAP